ncbi:MAG: tRNA/rRNA methyltransferase [Oligoflexales bacterium]|nr:tRNA/rRNA methyltransferase [Oligoflexales bacterium]
MTSKRKEGAKGSFAKFKKGSRSDKKTGKIPEREDKEGEIKVTGVNACRALFSKAREDIIRVYVTDEAKDLFKDLLFFCAKNKKAYHIVERLEMDAVTKSVHHENICILRKYRDNDLEEYLSHSEKIPGKPDIFILAESVANPHNQGAVLRAAAHFGCRGIVFISRDQTCLSGSAYRTAEGGAEYVPFFYMEDIGAVLDRFVSHGYTIFGSSSHKGRNLYDMKFKKKSLILFGAENSGLTKKALERCSQMIKIEGTGDVESLNVATSAALVLAEVRRQFLKCKPGPEGRNFLKPGN